MKPLTKRLMEAAILLVLVLGITAAMPDPNQQVISEPDRPEFLQAFRQAVEKQYGPVADGYSELIAPDTPDKPNKLRQNMDYLGSTITMVRSFSSPVGVSEAPVWFHQRMDEMEPAFDRLHALLDQGIYLNAYISESFENVNLIMLQPMTNLLRQSALRHWIRGDREKAVERQIDALRLGLAMRASPLLITQLISVAAVGMGVHGLDSLILEDPSPEWNQRIHESLAALNLPEWTLPPYLENQLLIALLFPPEQVMNSFGKYEWVPAVSLFHETRNPQRNTDAETHLREAGILPGKELNLFQVTSLINKWTTLPALRKRIQELPDEFYESDPFFPPETARKLPPLQYLTFRYQGPRFASPGMDPNPNFSNARIRFEVAKNEAQTALAAFWARTWRDQHGSWPSEQDVKDATSFADLQWHAVTDPEPFIRHLVSLYSSSEWFSDPAFTKDGEVVDAPVLDASGTVAVHFPIEEGDVEYQNNNSYFEPGRTYQPQEEEVRVIPEQEYRPWVRGVLQTMDPFLVSIREDKITRPYSNWGGYGFDDPNIAMGFVHAPEKVENRTRETYRVDLRPPKVSYWVTHPGPDGEPDGPALIYNPSNGTTSRGDIVRLAGWE